MKPSLPTTFLRLLTAEDKPAALAAAVQSLRNGEAAPQIFTVSPERFRQVPGSPFAYWVNEKILQRFNSHSSLESIDHERKARIGINTTDDTRFLRLWWEVFHSQVHKTWFPIFKGGGYAPFYLGSLLVIKWEHNGEQLKSYIASRGESPSRNIRSEVLYFQPGLTYSRRTQKGLAFQPLPERSIFTVKGPGVFASSNDYLKRLLGIANSSSFRLLVSLQIAFGSYEVGVIQRTPVPDLDNPQGERLGELALACVEIKRNLDRANETSHVFHLPALLQVSGTTLAERNSAWAGRVREAEALLNHNQAEIDALAFQLYGISPDEVENLHHRGTEALRTKELLLGGTEAASLTPSNSVSLGLGGEPHDGNLQPEGTEAASAEESDDEPDAPASEDTRGRAAALISYMIGCIFGRFDIRYATGERPLPILPNPFAPLPAYAPGMLQPGDRSVYPFTIAPDGILPDDEGHPWDIVAQLRAALDQIFGAQAESVERELIATLEYKDLRDYFRKSGKSGKSGFWQDHVQRYSRSRRKAPIYWLLQSPKRFYALWISYPAITNDTLAHALRGYVEPKLRRELERLAILRAEQQAVSGSDRKKRDREVERQEELLNDIQEFRDRLERAVRRGLQPDHNDGVVLTIAPLWELVPWTEARRAWEELNAGKYAWSSIGKQLQAHNAAGK